MAATVVFVRYAKKYVLLLTENIANERIINRKNKRKHNGHSHH